MAIGGRVDSNSGYNGDLPLPLSLPAPAVRASLPVRSHSRSIGQP